LFLLCLTAQTHVRAASDDVSDQFRFNISTHHLITSNLTGFVHLGYFNDPDLGERTYRIGWPGVTYVANHWLQLSGGLLTTYEDNSTKPNTLELRPSAGVKFFIPNDYKLHLYNFFRYEFLDTEDLNTHQWTGFNRIRSRFGVEVPLSSREHAWKPKTCYVLSDVEPFYRFDKNLFDPLRVRGGAGYVINSHLSCELVYCAQFTASTGSSLAFTENIIFLNIKVGLAKGLLERLYNPDFAD
jgi:hypothetical protein